MLAVEGLSIAYGEAQVVSDFDFTVPDAGFVALLGRNGAGKTTTLKGLTGLRPLHAGTVRYRGQTISGRSPHEIARLGIAYVPEGRGLFGTLSVAENLRTAAYGAGLTRREAKRSVEASVNLFPAIAPRLSQVAGTLSGGEQQQVAIARALVSRPSLLLLDEPSLGLAPMLIERLYDYLVALNKQDGLSVLVVEQYVNVALMYSQEVYVLERGRSIHHARRGDADYERARVTELIG